MTTEGCRTGVRRQSHLRLYGLIVLMVLFWSLNFIVGKMALKEFDPALLSGLRTALAALFILPVFFWRSQRAEVPRWRADWPVLVFLGVFGVALNQVFFVQGLSRTSVGHSAIIIGLTPILVLVMAAMAGQERIGARKLMGMGIALAGVASLGAASSKGAHASLAGDVLIFLASCMFAMFTVLGRSVTLRHGAVAVNTVAYAGAALALAPVTWWIGRSFDFTAVSAGAWAGLVYMALFPSMVCYLIYSYALTKVSASRLSAFSYLQPLLATALALPLLGERIHGGLVTGGALVLAGVYLTERS